MPANRLTLFAKGNLDLRDTLHSLRLGGALAWNGVGEVVRARFPDWSIRVRHETLTRTDALLAATGEPPEELVGRGLDLGAYPPESQFSRAFFETDADAFLLSLQSDVTTTLRRRRGTGWLLYPEGLATWSGADQTWLEAAFDRDGPLTVEASMAALEAIVARRRAISAAPILIYNLSPFVPGEWLHAHQGLEDILSTRIRRYNLGLIELSQRTGISIVDVEAVLARAGAERLKLDALHLSAEGCRLVAEEVVRVLEDLGLFDGAPA
ncbi:MAG TPA: SGNH/GDSL hydrolase family protein [Stellaceae bacterium]|nr:SGNH/GDSL hydrolase family protein [Stellaceae bacterium]